MVEQRVQIFGLMVRLTQEGNEKRNKREDECSISYCEMAFHNHPSIQILSTLAMNHHASSLIPTLLISGSSGAL